MSLIIEKNLQEAKTKQKTNNNKEKPKQPPQPLTSLRQES